MPKHDIVAIRESSHRGQKPKVSIKLHLRGPGKGTHAVLASTPPLDVDDRRIEALHAAFRSLADTLQGQADYLCSCPPPLYQRCRVCSCTNMQACPEGCHWVEPDLCSSCAASDSAS